MDTLHKPEVGHPAGAQVAHKVWIIDRAPAKGRRRHFAAVQEGVDFSEKYFGLRHD